MPTPRNAPSAAEPLVPAGTLHLVAFACSPAWVEAATDATGAATLPRFSMVAYTGGPMRLRGWRHPVIVDLMGLRIPTQQRPIRLGHEAVHGVGHTDRIQVQEGQLLASGVVSRDTAAAREVVISSKNGFPWQASIGASADEHEFIRDGQTIQVNGQAYPGPVIVIRRSTLGEISFVDLGADGNTSAAITAADSPGDSAMTAPRAATTTSPTSADVNAAETAAPATAPAASMMQAPAAGTSIEVVAVGDATTSTDPLVLRLRAAAATETARIDAVRTLASGHPALAATAIRDGWDVTRTELEVLRAARPQAPAVHVRDETLTGAILEAACLQAGRHSDLERVCAAPALDEAQRRFRGRMGLQRLLMEAAWANGCPVRQWSDDPRSILRAAWGAGGASGIAAGLSSVDLPGILSNVANKFLLDGFSAAETTWRSIARIGSVQDFKQVTRYRLAGNLTYERVAPGGELKHGTLGEERFTNQADTFGKLIAIDRRDQVNDDLGVITGVPQEMGRGAGQALNDLFWTVFLDHVAFFTAANRNLLQGADTALSIDGLTKAEVLFNQQVDSSGRPLGIAPAILLVPTSLNAIGNALIKATEIRESSGGSGANTKYPIFNPHQGKYRVEMSRYLDNAHLPGGSPKAWYVLADPADLAAIEVVFLGGQEAPVIEAADPNFATLGIQLRGYHDFGVAKQDPRAAVKALGA